MDELLRLLHRGYLNQSPSLENRTGKCPGHCCRDFDIPLTPDDIERINDAVLRDDWSEVRLRYDPKELAKVAAMVIHNGMAYDVTPTGLKRARPNGNHFYTCKHFNRETSLCGDYENRPEMCKSFGVDNQCKYVGCDFRVAREWYDWVGPPSAEMDATAENLGLGLMELTECSPSSQP